MANDFPTYSFVNHTKRSQRRALPRIVFPTKLESIFFSSGKLNVWYLFATLSISTAKLLIIWETSFIYHLRFAPPEIILHQFLILLYLCYVSPHFAIFVCLSFGYIIIDYVCIFTSHRYEKIFPTRHFVVSRVSIFRVPFGIPIKWRGLRRDLRLRTIYNTPWNVMSDEPIYRHYIGTNGLHTWP